MKKNRLTISWIGLGVLGLVLFFRILLHASFEELSLKVFDRFQKIKPRVYQEAPVKFLDIDDATLEKLGQWPWPRTLTADLVQRLAEGGASAIVFDIVFAEPDRTSPAEILKVWGRNFKTELLQNSLSKIPNHDLVLAETIAKAPVVTGFILTNEDNQKVPLLKTGFAFSGDDPQNFIPPFKGAVNNLLELEKAASGNGSFNFLAEADGIIRRVPVLFRQKETLYPALFMEGVRVAQGAKSYIVKASGSSGETSFGEKTGLIEIKAGQFVVPTDPNGKLWLYDTGPRKERYIPAWKIFQKDFDTSQTEGQIIFIGSSASGLRDLRATPLNPVTSGTEIHVQLTEQIILGAFLHRPDWAEGAEVLYMIILSLALIFLLPSLGALPCAAASLSVAGLAFFFSWHAFTQWQLLFDPVVPSVACLIIYLAVSLLNFLQTEKDRQHIRGAFSRYLSPEVVKRLSEKPDQLKLGGEIREMTVLFADIRGFTALSENYSAQELTQFMNRFLTPMTDIILKHKGTIDKYMGDCVMAFWNAPLDDPQHALHACQAAVTMQKYLKIWNQENPSQPVELAIGINTGKCCVGNMGSSQRFDYSALGDEVNLASRLQSVSGNYGADILVSEKTYAAVKEHFKFTELDLIQVKGKSKPVKTYSLLF